MSVAGEVLGSINNFFELEPSRGEFEVEDGELRAVSGNLPALADGQYYLVRGSAMNDGLHVAGGSDLHREAPFSGEVVPCAVPAELRALIREVAEWQGRNGATVGPYQSEGFDGYSYSRATDSQTGGAVTWQSAFRARLNRWRRL